MSKHFVLMSAGFEAALEQECRIPAAGLVDAGQCMAHIGDAILGGIHECVAARLVTVPELFRT